MEISLFTELSEKECIEKIKLNAKKSVSFGFITLMFEFGKIIYKIERNQFKLWKLYNRNIQMPTFIGRFTKNKNGTLIIGYFEKNKFFYTFEVVWFSLLGLIICLILLAAIKEIVSIGRITNSTILSILAPFGMVIFGIWNFHGMRSQADEGKKEILNFIKVNLRAK